MTEPTNSLYVLEEEQGMVRAVSLINSMKSPWLKKGHMATAVEWGNRHQKYHRKLLTTMELTLIALDKIEMHKLNDIAMSMQAIADNVRR